MLNHKSSIAVTAVQAEYQAVLAPKARQQQLQRAERERLRLCFAEAFPPAGELNRAAVSDRDIAKECEVTPQAIVAWRNTGRIAKRHLATLARLSGRPLGWWLGIAPADATDSLPEDALATRQIEVLRYWALLDPNQEQEWFEELKAQAAANMVTAEHMRDKQLPRTVSNSRVESAYKPVSRLRAALPRSRR